MYKIISLLKGLTLEDILTGTSKLRNPGITRIFEMLDYVESYGTRFKRIFDLYEKFNLKPQIVVLPNFFRVVMPNIKYKENVGLNSLQNAILSLIKNNFQITQKEMANQLNVTSRTIERNVSELKNKGILNKSRSKKKGEWIITSEL